MTMKIKNYPYILTGLNVEVKLASDFKNDKTGTSIATGKVNIQPYFYQEATIDQDGKCLGVKIVDKHVYIFKSLNVSEDLNSIVAGNFTAALLNTCRFPDFKSKIGLDLEFVISGETLDITQEKLVLVKFTPELLAQIIQKLHDKEFPKKVEDKEIAAIPHAVEDLQITDKKNKTK